MKERNIAISVILSILTCGIYLIIWQWSLNNELKVYNKKPENSLVCFLLSLVTCGIYYIIWMYNIGKEIEEAGGDKNASMIYLILTVVGLSFVGLAMAQNEVNKICQEKNTLL